MPACKQKQKNAILSLTSTSNLTQTQNLNPNTNDNNSKNKRVNEQMSTHSCSPILSKKSSFAHESANSTSFEKLTSINPNCLYFIMLDKGNLRRGANTARFERGDW